MKAILNDIFTNIADFRSFAPYIESNVTFEELNSSAINARKSIIIITGREVFAEILQKEDEKKDALKSAMANLILAKQMIFDVIQRRKDEIDVYKHEQEQMKKSYIDNYYNSMDTLMQLLSESKSEAWKKTKYYQKMESLKIKSTEQFDELYPIDQSYLFFFRTISIQQEALEKNIGSYLNRVEGKEDLKAVVLRDLAKMVVSIALRRFDILEFPSTIRNLFEDSNVGRNGTQEQQRMLSLSQELEHEVEQSLQSIDMVLSESSTVDSRTCSNREDDKIFLMA